MNNKISYLKATVVGGIVFLIPIAVLLLIIGKVMVPLKALAGKVAPILPVESVAGFVVLNLIALALILLFCMLAGLAAQSATGKRIVTKLEDNLLSSIPGYSFVKGLGDSLKQSDELAEDFIPIALRFDESIQIAFEIERQEEGMVAVYLPGAPNPWSGSVVYVTSDRVKRLEMTVTEAVKNIRMLGKGSLDYVNRHGKAFPTEQ